MSGSQRHIKEWFADLSTFLIAICKRTAGYITGGIVAAMIAIYFALSGKFHPWSVWALVSLAFFAAAFAAWREQYRATQRVLREDVLKKAGDYIRQEKKRVEKMHATLSVGLYALPALLYGGGDELNSESDVVWVCDEMVRYKFTHPFAAFTGSSTFQVRKGDWLRFLKELRISKGNDGSPTAAFDFWHNQWSKNNP